MTTTMTIEDLRERIPDYAKDLKLNLSSVLRTTELNEQQLWGTALGAAMASGSPELLEAVAAEARGKLSETAFAAAASAASLMGMNNVYYRFLHFAGHEKYRTIRAGLRMNAIRTHGVDPVDFELWCLAVSAINGCEACVQSHDKVVRDKGLSEEGVLEAVRVASVIKAVAGVLNAEKTLAA